MLSDCTAEHFSICSDVCLFGKDDAQNLKMIRESACNDLRGKNIALHAHPANAVRFSLALVGFVNSILIVPNDACAAFISRAEANLDIDIVVTDGLVETKHWRCSIYNINNESVRGREPANWTENVNLPTKWLLATSGTTGTPKVVSHSFDSLTRTISKNKSDKRHSWGLLYDPARFAGFQVVLQAAISGARLLIPPLAYDFDARIAFLAENGCTALSATPSLWRKILMTKAFKNLNLEQVTLGGEIADQRILNSLSQQFPDANIAHIFASTEAGVGFSVKDKLAGFPASWLQTGVRGVGVIISSERTLCLKNTYSGQSYLGSTESIDDGHGWIDTGDIVEVEGNRVFFKGRLNGAINIGGNKVIPEEIEAEIAGIAGVSQVLVRSKPSSIAGSLVEALIVADTATQDAACLIKTIKQHCRSVFPKFKVPAFVRIVDELPVGGSGKVKR
jgi:acyl-CoA synthetase (AMP-forming)/AMP-acid ligase II